MIELLLPFFQYEYVLILPLFQYEFTANLHFFQYDVEILVLFLHLCIKNPPYEESEDNRGAQGAAL